MNNNLKRFDRIIAILTQLQSKRVVKAQELAARFEVSLRTIYRDIRTLETSGVPIYSEPGVGYYLVDGYRLPPIMFTREEAGSFVAAERLMQKFTDKTLGAHYQSAVYKIKAVLRGTEKDWVSAIENQIMAVDSEVFFNKSVPNALQILFESIAEKRQVSIQYEAFGKKNITQRTIEPVGLFHESNYWYVMAYCYLRKEYRQFRTDRIQQITKTDTSFGMEHSSLQNHLEQREKHNAVTIRISVDKDVVRYIKSGRKYYGFVSEEVKGDRVEMIFAARNIDNSFARWFLMFGDYATIIEPEELKERVRHLTDEIIKNLK